MSFYLRNNSKSDLGRGKWRVHEPTMHQPQWEKAGTGIRYLRNSLPDFTVTVMLATSLAETIYGNWWAPSGLERIKALPGLLAQVSGESVFSVSQSIQAVKELTWEACRWIPARTMGLMALRGSRFTASPGEYRIVQPLALGRGWPWWERVWGLCGQSLPPHFPFCLQPTFSDF